MKFYFVLYPDLIIFGFGSKSFTVESSEFFNLLGITENEFLMSFEDFVKNYGGESL